MQVPAQLYRIDSYMITSGLPVTGIHRCDSALWTKRDTYLRTAVRVRNTRHLTSRWLSASEIGITLPRDGRPQQKWADPGFGTAVRTGDPRHSASGRSYGHE